MYVHREVDGGLVDLSVKTRAFSYFRAFMSDITLRGSLERIMISETMGIRKREGQIE